MPKKIVVSFRGVVPGTAADGARYIAQALAVKKRAEAHGALLCGWSALTFSFCFEPDEIEEAVLLAVQVFEDVGAGLSAGLTAGDLAPIGDRGHVAGLAWGMPLVRAATLSRSARPGEVVVDETFYLEHESDLGEIGFRGDGEGLKRLVPITEEVNDAPIEVELDSVVEPLPLPDPQRPKALSAPPPMSGRASDPHIETAKRALLQGDTASLERLIEELRETGEHAHLVERISGFVALRRGATADALRRLRAATLAAKDPAAKARARLAYGVALAGAGRAESALLEALEALARAREAGDRHGEHACALFLARLSARSGHADAAGVWARIAARVQAGG